MNVEKILDWSEQVSWLGFQVWNNSVQRWLVAIVVGLLALVILKTVAGFIKRRVAKLADATAAGWDDGISQTVQATRNWFLFLVAVYAGSLVLELPPRVREIIQSAAILALLVQSALWASTTLRFTIEYYLKNRRDSDPALATTVSAMSFIGNLILWSIVLMLALDNIGVDVTALVAGLGVGGIAVALAAQNILGDLFASLSIVLDKPFVLGDFIIVGQQMGTVEKIGLKTTRVKASSGEQLVFANTDLLQSRIQNFKKMKERRIAFSIGVIYETPQEKVASIPEMIREIVESQDQVRFDRSHFKAFGDFSLNFETVYYVLVPDYAVYMDAQQAINLALFEKFANEGIEFAYPTQTMFVRKIPTDRSEL